MPAAIAGELRARRVRLDIHTRGVHDGAACESKARVCAGNVCAHGILRQDLLVDVPMPVHGPLEIRPLSVVNGRRRRAHVQVRARAALPIALAQPPDGEVGAVAIWEGVNEGTSRGSVGRAFRRLQNLKASAHAFHGAWRAQSGSIEWVTRRGRRWRRGRRGWFGAIDPCGTGVDDGGRGGGAGGAARRIAPSTGTGTGTGTGGVADAPRRTRRHHTAGDAVVGAEARKQERRRGRRHGRRRELAGLQLRCELARGERGLENSMSANGELELGHRSGKLERRRNQTADARSPHASAGPPKCSPKLRR